MPRLRHFYGLNHLHYVTTSSEQDSGFGIQEGEEQESGFSSQESE
jgi:hypothetical protein